MRHLRTDVYAAVVGEALEDLRAIVEQEEEAVRLGQAEDPGHRAGRIPAQAGEEQTTTIAGRQIIQARIHLETDAR